VSACLADCPHPPPAGDMFPVWRLCVLCLIPVSAAMPMLAAPFPACTVKDGAAAADLAGAVAWVCGAGGLDCAPIRPGGAYYGNNNATLHADWAFNAYYQAHKQDGVDTCFFGGDAALVPAPPGHFLFAKGGSMAYPTPPKAEIGQFDTVAAGQSKTYTTPKFSGTLVAGSPTFFSAWVAGSDASQTMTATLEFDLNGDGQPERIETYKARGMGVVPQYQVRHDTSGCVRGRLPACH
jgi:hypothetical protein